MMPLPRLAARRPSRKAEVSPLLGSEWRSRERSEWGWMVVKMGDMHRSTGSQGYPPFEPGGSIRSRISRANSMSGARTRTLTPEYASSWGTAPDPESA